jgi:hypothetical protein
MTPSELEDYISHTEAALYADMAYIKQELDRLKETLGKRTWVDVQWFIAKANEHHDGLERALNNITKKLMERASSEGDSYTGTKV